MVSSLHPISFLMIFTLVILNIMQMALIMYTVVFYRSFPNCKYGNKCLYIHPQCKFDSRFAACPVRIVHVYTYEEYNSYVYNNYNESSCFILCVLL